MAAADSRRPTGNNIEGETPAEGKTYELEFTV
jgi:hypothetical protein